MTFEIGSRLCVRAFGDEEVMNEIFTLPSIEMTGSSLVRVATTDTFIHGWDLARATGPSTNLSPDIGTKLLVVAKLSIPAIL